MIFVFINDVILWSLDTDLVVCGSKLQNLWWRNFSDARMMSAVEGDGVDFFVVGAYL